MPCNIHKFCDMKSRITYCIRMFFSAESCFRLTLIFSLESSDLKKGKISQTSFRACNPLSCLRKDRKFLVQKVVSEIEAESLSEPLDPKGQLS